LRETITILKMDHTGKEVWRYTGEFVEGTSERVTIKTVFRRDNVGLGYVVFRKGDYPYEHFYLNRWYNIFQLHDKDTHQIKGLYCNLARPTQWTNHATSQEDLALNLWICAG